MRINQYSIELRGRVNAKYEVVRKMKRAGLISYDIAKLTDLTVETIQKVSSVFYKKSSQLYHNV